jgi:hypothetical protein
MKTQEAEAQNLEYLALNSTTARDELLDDFADELNRPKDISVKTLILTFISVFLALLVLLPKVYIGNQIYYNSKDINKMYHKYTALKEEQAYLKRELERLRYQTLIIDDIE